MKSFFKDKRNLVIVLLAALFFIKAPEDGLRFVFWVLAGVSACFVFDFIINKIFLKRNFFSKSAVISGFIVFGILDYRQPWLVLIIFSALAIISKYIIRFNQRHIFNPAAFALFFATLFRIPLIWGIESSAFLIIIFGIYLAYSFKKIFHVAGFLAFFAGLFSLSGINPLGLISWFFVFIMLIEPKTSGYGRLKGFAFGAVSGIISFSVFKYLAGYDPFIFSLVAANMVRPILEKQVTSAHKNVRRVGYV